MESAYESANQERNVAFSGYGSQRHGGVLSEVIICLARLRLYGDPRLACTVACIWRRLLAPPFPSLSFFIFNSWSTTILLSY